MDRRLVQVALPPPLSRQLTYSVPPELNALVGPGSVVLVPVQQRLVTGFVVADEAGDRELAPGRIRDITQVVDTEAPISAEVVRLCAWLADYYLAPVGAALAAALPPGVRLTSSRTVQLAVADGDPPPPDAVQERVLTELRRARGPLKVTTLRSRLGKRGLEGALRGLLQHGRIEMRPHLAGGGVRARRRQLVRLADPQRARADLPAVARRAPAQGRCLERLLQGGPVAKRRLLEEGFGYSVLKGLQGRGLTETVEQEVLRDPLADLDVADAPTPEPTADQREVLRRVHSALDAGRFEPLLLRGVTGSGKTLVYLLAVERVLRSGRSAIVLTPEIALAWQMVRRFRAHFGETVAVLHSQLSVGERYDTWRRLRRGERRLVIGARSAVLAPVKGLGLIIVDEEHDGAYFQDDLESQQPLVYHGRDLAVVRARLAGVPVILGSATPSLESWSNARSGKYTCLSLPRRIDDRPLARVEVVDMRREPFQGRQRTLFSKTLRLKIRERLERGEQIVLLQNRRGFSPIVQCVSCGEAVACRRCHVSLTYHRSHGEGLRCHYCDFRRPVPSLCPACGSGEVRLTGAGTQKVEAALEEQFPGIRVIRMDVDTTGWKGAHDRLVESFRRREADVLLGTQMVAKGLDFPEVTLVGVISADTGFHLPDFRAAERSFQLLTQAGGTLRAGLEPRRSRHPDPPPRGSRAARRRAPGLRRLRRCGIRRPAGGGIPAFRTPDRVPLAGRIGGGREPGGEAGNTGTAANRAGRGLRPRPGAGAAGAPAGPLSLAGPARRGGGPSAARHRRGGAGGHAPRSLPLRCRSGRRRRPPIHHVSRIVA